MKVITICDISVSLQLIPSTPAKSFYDLAPSTKAGYGEHSNIILQIWLERDASKCLVMWQQHLSVTLQAYLISLMSCQTGLSSHSCILQNTSSEMNWRHCRILHSKRMCIYCQSRTVSSILITWLSLSHWSIMIWTLCMPIFSKCTLQDMI